MRTDQEILEDFSRILSDFVQDYSGGMRDRMLLAFEIRDGRQWSTEDLKNRDFNNRNPERTTASINIAAPTIRAAAGAEAMTRTKVAYLADDPDFDQEADQMEDGAEFVQAVSGLDEIQATAKEDCFVCGLGAYVNFLFFGMKRFPYGIPQTRRIAPFLTYYDRSVRGNNLNRDGKFCGYVVPMRSYDLTKYIDGLDDYESEDRGAFAFDEVFQSMLQNQEDAECVYHHFWTEQEVCYDTQNPIKNNERLAASWAAVFQEPRVANMFEEATAEAQIDFDADVWALDKTQYKAVGEAFALAAQLLGLPEIKLKSAKRNVDVRYHAQIARGRLIAKPSRCFVQDVFPLQFYTGYYDETLNEYYGWMRAIEDVQDILNKTISDLVTYGHTLPNGGKAFLRGGTAADYVAYKETRAITDATPYIGEMEVIPAHAPNTGQVLSEGARLALELVYKVTGLTPEMMGITDSGNMTNALYGRLVRQSMAVLHNFVNNSKSVDMGQAQINVAFVQTLARNMDGLSVKHIGTGGERKSFRLRKSSIASSYSIVPAPRPVSGDDKQDTFDKLSGLLPTLPPESQALVWPLLVRYLPLDFSDREELARAFAPPQPAQPDPANQALLAAQTRLTNADALMKEASAQEKQAQINWKDEEIQSVIEKNLASARKADADTVNSTTKQGIFYG